jgi:hypothetical protein
MAQEDTTNNSINYSANTSFQAIAIQSCQKGLFLILTIGDTHSPMKKYFAP